jgi:hypothetical protein
LVAWLVSIRTASFSHNELRHNEAWTHF